MGNSSNSNSNSEMIGFTGKMLMVSVILFFFIAGFILFLQFYAKWFWYTQDEETRQQRTRIRRRRLDFSPGYSTESSPAAAAVIPKQKRSLDPSVLKSLPIVDYDSKDFKEGLECAVCLSDLSDGEKLRLLPNCNHGFHLECIDMWFQSHSTCPLCRNAIIGELNSLETVLGLPIGEIPDDGPNFPTNVLFCGDETRIVTFGVSGEDVNSSSAVAAAAAAGMVVVDIPATATGRQGNEEEGGKSPLTTRMRSLKRLLSRDKERRLNPSGSGSSSSSVELEQGNRG